MSFTPGYDPSVGLSQDSWVILVQKGLLVTFHAQLLVRYRDLPVADCRSHHLGRYRGETCFLVVLARTVCDQAIERSNLRAFLGQVEEGAFTAAAKALQFSHWLESHRYCGRCGNLNLDVASERALRCPQCHFVVYPRISPCVIGLVWRGNQILLAHNAAFKAHRYSILAGFIEPGESAEEALEREIKEEVGVDVHAPNYVGSQPWPFPSQLMLGFFAQYKSGDVCVDGKEILHASWFDIDKLPLIPGPLTISGQLIERFVQSREREVE